MSNLQFTKFLNVKIPLSSVFLLQCLWILSNVKFTCSFMLENTIWMLSLVINGFTNENNFWNSVFGWSSGFICWYCILCRLQVVSRWSKLFPSIQHGYNCNTKAVSLSAEIVHRDSWDKLLFPCLSSNVPVIDVALKLTWKLGDCKPALCSYSWFLLIASRLCCI